MNFLDERLPARFWDKVSPCPMSGCWLWTATTTKQQRPGRGSGGYGRFSVVGRNDVLVHRHAYEALVGPIPAGLDLDHLCRVRCCCNPAHLEPVTRAENIRRGAWDPVAASAKARAGVIRFQKSKTHCPQGHAYVEANMYRYGNRRVCKRCAIDRTNARRQAKAG